MGNCLNGSNASLRTDISMCKLDPYPLNSGVPQWSGLGCLLLALYVNELPSLVSNPLLLFANDIKLYRIIRSHDDCLQLQFDIEQWSKRWLLSFNVTKLQSAVHW